MTHFRKPCPVCDGTGQVVLRLAPSAVDKRACWQCGGIGSVPDDQDVDLSVEVPADD